MADVSLSKKTSLPAQPNPNDIIFVKSGSLASMYVCDTEGTPFGVIPSGDYVSKVNGKTGNAQLDLAFSGGILSITGSSATQNLDNRYFKTTDNLAWSQISSKPTTVAGYGITDAYTKTESDAITGLLANLQTTTKTNLVSAINELLTSINEGMRTPSPIDCSANPNYPASEQGDTYKVTVAGKIGGASGKDVDVNDTIVCTATNGGGDQATVGGSFYVIQGNITDATTTTTGYGRIATQAEVMAGGEDKAWVTPETLNGLLDASYYTKSQSDGRYLQSYTETDPVFVASAAHGISSSDITTWNTALQSGDNVSDLTNDAGYLTSFTETDPVWTAAKDATTIISGDWSFTGDSINLPGTINLPAGASGINLATGNLSGYLGRVYGNGDVVIASNAQQAFGDGTWTQEANVDSIALRLNHSSDTLQIYTAAAGKASGDFNTFWGTSKTVATTDQIPDTSYLLDTRPSSIPWDNLWGGKTVINTASGPLGTEHGIYIPHYSNLNYGSELVMRNNNLWLRSMENGTVNDWTQFADQDWVNDQGFAKSTDIPTDYLSTSPSTTGGVLESLSDAFSTTRSGAFFASSGSANNPTNISYNILNLYRSSTAWSQLAFMASGGTLEDPWYNNRPGTSSWVQLASRDWVTDQGYLTSFTELDPVFTASAAHGIASADIANWNAAYSAKHDALTLGTNKNGLSLDGQELSLAAATTSAAGAMTAAMATKLAGIATNANNYTLPTATESVLGGIKVGSRLSIASGILSADSQTDNNFTTAYKNKLDGIATGANNYSLPTASGGVLGGVKIGDNMAVDGSGVLTMQWAEVEW